MISDVYTAGESVIEEADGQSLCRAIASPTGIAPTFVKDLKGLKAALVPILRPDDVVLKFGGRRYWTPRKNAVTNFGQSDWGLSHERLAQPLSSEAARGLRGRLLWPEPLAAHTSWRVGGPADYFFVPFRCRRSGYVLSHVASARPSALGWALGVIYFQGRWFSGCRDMYP
ncbi:MAG: hypothetical protein CM1200mP41_23820 [Gammaproteobacteria bacterium]|nr:MAG: hypothetical protein CM1200mP41_23820 [Gammaproteobacteria bacterium]